MFDFKVIYVCMYVFIYFLRQLLLLFFDKYKHVKKIRILLCFYKKTNRKKKCYFEL